MVSALRLAKLPHCSRRSPSPLAVGRPIRDRQAVPVLEGLGEALKLGPPVALAGALGAIVDRGKEPVRQREPVVREQLLPGVLLDAMRLQSLVVAAQHSLLPLPVDAL